MNADFAMANEIRRCTRIPSRICARAEIRAANDADHYADTETATDSNEN